MMGRFAMYINASCRSSRASIAEPLIAYPLEYLASRITVRL